MKAHPVTEFVIGKGTAMEGTVSSPGLIRVEGSCKGSLRTSSELVIARDAKMEGDVDAGSVVVAGSMKGNIVSHGLVTLSSSARVEANISTPLFRMESGAFFDGSVTRTVG